MPAPPPFAASAKGPSRREDEAIRAYLRTRALAAQLAPAVARAEAAARLDAALRYRT